MNNLEFITKFPPGYTYVEANRSAVIFNPYTVDPYVMIAVRRIDGALSRKSVRPVPPNIIGRIMPGSTEYLPRHLGKPGRRTVFYMHGDSLQRIPGTREEFRAHAGYLPCEITNEPLALYIAPDTGKPIATWDAVLQTAINTALIAEISPYTNRAVRNGSYSTIISHGMTEASLRIALHEHMGVNQLYMGNGLIFNYDTGRTIASELIGRNAPTLNPLGAVIFVGE